MMKQEFDIVEVIKAEAGKVNSFIAEDLQALRGSMEPFLCDVLEYGLLAGGKRVRPLLVVAAARLCGNRDEKVYTLGMAFEYLHAATLFHDDIIDQADFRRGKESVAKKFGIGPAILAGDFLHARSMRLVGELVGERGLTSFCGATSGMVDGEFLQLRNASEYNLSELDYYRTVMGKTGLLIASACEVGAIYGGGSDEQIQALRVYGEKLGSAFQIIDDLLDYLGDSQQTGKSVGNDLLEGKMTLPLIFAITAAADRDHERMRQIIKDEKLRHNQFDEMCSLIVKYNGFARARKQAEDDITLACRQLEIFADKNQQEHIFLKALAHYILARNK